MLQAAYPKPITFSVNPQPVARVCAAEDLVNLLKLCECRDTAGLAFLLIGTGAPNHFPTETEIGEGLSVTKTCF